MKIIYLKPLSGYATPLRSDTLWGLLCWGIRHLWGEEELEDFIKKCNDGKPPFVVSSTFPCKKYGEHWIPFFPNPLPFPDEREEDIAKALTNAEFRKKYKKAFDYVNLNDFTKILNGEPVAVELLKRLRDTHEEKERLKEEAKRMRKPKEERVITPAEVKQTAPRLEDFHMTHNTIDRLRGGTLNLPVDGGAQDEVAGQLFHSPEHYWTDKYTDPHQDSNTGIFFLADGPDTSKLEAVLRLYRHWGFGADRTSGKGFFETEIHDFDLPKPADANAMLNLSLFRPTPSELNAIDGFADTADAPFRYRIELREGWVGGDGIYLPKTPHRYFTEGSVFPLIPELKERHLGNLVKQQFEKPHPVYDNGFGFMLHLKWNAP